MMWVITVALAAAGQPGVAKIPTPSAVERQIVDRGAKAVVTGLWNAGSWDQVEQGIAAGTPAWVRLAPLLSEGTDAGTSEGLAHGLAIALPKAPGAVLAVLDISGRSVPRSPAAVCSASFYEGDPTIVADYRVLAIGAISRVGDPALASARIACLTYLAAATPTPRIADIRPIALHDGFNTVAGFLPDGASATIVQAWRANGNAHSHHDWLVLGPTAEQHDSAEVTLADPDTKMLQDVISDAPFDGERVLRTVRFARGTVDGRPTSLLLQAVLNDTPSGVPADHATATVRVFRLKATGGDAGDSPLEFQPISSATTTKRYCNAELALSQMLSVPLSPGYGGPNEIDGCFGPESRHGKAG